MILQIFIVKKEEREFILQTTTSYKIMNIKNLNFISISFSGIHKKYKILFYGSEQLDIYSTYILCDSEPFTMLFQCFINVVCSLNSCFNFRVTHLETTLNY